MARAGVEPMGASINIRTLGGFRLDVAANQGAQRPVQLPRKPLRLLQFLLATNADGTSTRVVADTLWPDADADAALHAFEVTLHRLRRLIGRADVLTLATGTLRLNRTACRVDLWAVDTVLRQIDAAPPVADLSTLAGQLLECHHGEFLAGVEASWVALARWRISSRFARAVGQLGDGMVACGELDAAIDLYRRALEVEPSADGLYHRCRAALESAGRNREAWQLAQAFMGRSRPGAEG